MLKSPSKPTEKYAQLLSVCRELCIEAKKITEGWKRALATAVKVRDALKRNPDTVFSDFNSSLSQESSKSLNSLRKRESRHQPDERRSQSTLISNSEFSAVHAHPIDVQELQNYDH
eukprot:snap_masked-scaffold_2-processed-gene-4.41-mRNA-1 protein AED:1.00 eAED:1.00 QI:0/0/0/0/1/1/2/0/115